MRLSGRVLVWAGLGAALLVVLAAVAVLALKPSPRALVDSATRRFPQLGRVVARVAPAPSRAQPGPVPTGAQFTIDVGHPVRSINPLIYGVAVAPADALAGHRGSLQPLGRQSEHPLQLVHRLGLELRARLVLRKLWRRTPVALERGRCVRRAQPEHRGGVDADRPDHGVGRARRRQRHPLDQRARPRRPALAGRRGGDRRLRPRGEPGEDQRAGLRHPRSGRAPARRRDLPGRLDPAPGASVRHGGRWRRALLRLRQRTGPLVGDAHRRPSRPGRLRRSARRLPDLRSGDQGRRSQRAGARAHAVGLDGLLLLGARSWDG